MEKKSLFSALTIAIAGAALLAGFVNARAEKEPENHVLVRDGGEPVATIVVADDPLPAVQRMRVPGMDRRGRVTDPDKLHTQRHVAERLQYWLKRASDVELPIVTASEAPSEGMLILVGKSALTEHHGIEPPSESEGVRIRTFDRGVALVGEVTQEEADNTHLLPGGIDRGTQHAVSFFLEKYLGYRFYFSNPQKTGSRRQATSPEDDPELGVVIPRSNTLSIPDSIDFETAPDFSYRATRRGFHGAELRLGNASFMGVGHTDDGWKHRYKNEYPEYFVLNKDGSRDFNHLDYSNPDVVDQRIENLERFYADDPDHDHPSWVGPTNKFIAISPADNLRTSQTERAQHMTREEVNPTKNYEHQPGNWGRQSHMYFWHIKKVAEEVKKRWPEKRIVTLAYQGYTLPPDFDLPDNVDVVLAVLTPSHMYKEPEAKKRVDELVKAWHEKLGRERERLYFWDYPCFPCFYTAAPVAYPHLKQQWLQDYKPYVAGEYLNSGGRTPQDSHWFINLWTRMLWDTDMDVDAHLRDYCENFFGPAAEPMEKFYRLMIDRYENVEWSGSNDVDYSAGLYEGFYEETYTPEAVREMANYFNEAQLAVRNAPAQANKENSDIYRKRVEWMREWLEEFQPGSFYSPKSGFLAEAEAAHRWTDRVPEYTATTVDRAPEPNFTDPAWLRTPSTELRFGKEKVHRTRPFDRLGFSADMPTRVQVLHDAKRVYVAMKCSQPHDPNDKDSVTAGFYDEDDALLELTVRSDGSVDGEYDGLRTHVRAGPGWWGVFLEFPKEILEPGMNGEGTLRANFSRSRSPMPEEDLGDDGGPRVEMPEPVGLAGAAYSKTDVVSYTWSPIHAGQLGWGRFPWRERGIIKFESD